MPIAFASVLYSGCLHLDVSEKWLWAIDEKIEIGCNFSGPLHSFSECKKMWALLIPCLWILFENVKDFVASIDAFWKRERIKGYGPSMYFFFYEICNVWHLIVALSLREKWFF